MTAPDVGFWIGIAPVCGDFEMAYYDTNLAGHDVAFGQMIGILQRTPIAPSLWKLAHEHWPGSTAS